MTDEIKEVAAERRRLRGELLPVRSHTHIALGMGDYTVVESGDDSAEIILFRRTAP